MKGTMENGKPEVSEVSAAMPGRLSPLLLTTPFLAMVLLQLVGFFFPGSGTWGFNYWSLVDPVAVSVVFAGAILLLISPVTRTTSGLFGKLAVVGEFFRGPARFVLVVLLSIGITAILFYFRSKALIYGDGYTILNDTVDSTTVVLYRQYYLQPLAVYFHHYLFHMINGLEILSGEEIYALINAVGGMVGVWALVRITGQLTGDSTTRVFLLLAALTSSSTILFFGYVENYTWATSMSLWSLSFAIRYARDRRGLAGLVMFSMLAFLFHMITLSFIVVAIMALFIRSGPAGNRLLGIRLPAISLLFILGSVLFIAVSQLMDVPIFVSLLPTLSHSYWSVSPTHLIDVLNQLMLVGGPGITLLIFTLIAARKKALAAGPEDGLMGTAALLAFLTAFWIDPGIGASRDWDLLSFYGFPLTLWAAYRFVKLFPKRKISPQWVVAITVVAIVHLGGNLYEKRHPDLAVTRLDSLLSEDDHYQPGYDISRRCIAWAKILQTGAGRGDLALKYLKRRLESFPDSYQACFNLGDIYYRDGELDSAAKYLALGLDIKPDEVRFLLNMSKIERIRQQYASSASWAAKAMAVDSNHVEALTEMGIGLSNTGDVGGALPYFRKAYRLAPDSLNQLVNLGYCYAMAQIPDSTYYYLTLALPRVPESAKVGIYCCVIDAALKLGRTEKAAEYLEQLRRIAPGAPQIQEFAARLSEGG
ncbi:MAG: tetratricopeptide repeat protein [Candidatus Zixiibacteriota bacterium]|nr:MAG: tetratricopeptide repeat protein [candidate division Zixibacteria bacterium]